MPFPDAPDLGANTIYTEFDAENYFALTDQIDGIVAALAQISDNDGNVELGAGGVVSFGGVTCLTESGGVIQAQKLSVTDAAGLSPLEVTGGASVTSVTAISTMNLGSLIVTGVITTDKVTENSLTITQVSEPSDPDDGRGVMWLSNGTGTGDAGDLVIKITHGDVTKAKTLVDFA